MINYPNINPDLVHLGFLRVRWYGIMYLLGFLSGRQILRALCRKSFLKMNPDLVDDLLVYLFAGMLIGARTLYMVVYYQGSDSEPWHWYTPFAVWHGGLAFHGGVIGMCAAIALFGFRHHVRFWNLADALALCAPIGIALGRIGNFINAELFGRETNVPWAMQFPIRDFDGAILAYTTPRHPSQIYEALGEGLCTLLIVWFIKSRVKHQGVIAGCWISSYAAIRFFLEFFREKDEQMRYYFGWMTMGQILCLIMFLLGLAILSRAVSRAVPIDVPQDMPFEETPAA